MSEMLLVFATYAGQELFIVTSTQLRETQGRGGGGGAVHHPPNRSLHYAKGLVTICMFGLTELQGRGRHRRTCSM